MFNLDEICSDLCSVHPLQDAFDAVGYFQLALAAALEDRVNPEALYVVYMKLAEIHGNHIPDAQLCQVYRDRAQSLKRVLAGEEGAAVGEENMDAAETEDPDVERTESNLTSMPENVKCKDTSFPRTCVMHGGTEDTCAGTNNEDSHGKEDHNINLPDTDGRFLDASGFETVASQSYSDSIFTESFDTAKEQISDSCSSTDTLQTDHFQTDGKDFDTAHSMPSQIAVNHITSHTDAPNTDSDIQDEQNTLSDKADAHADHIQKDVCQSDADKAETVGVNTDKALGVDKTCDRTEKDKSSDTHSEHTDLNDVHS